LSDTFVVVVIGCLYFVKLMDVRGLKVDVSYSLRNQSCIHLLLILVWTISKNEAT